MKRTEKMEDTLNKMHRLAADCGGICLSSDFPDGNRLRWRCSKGHEWESLPRNIEAGHWCPLCGRAKMAEKKRNRSLADLKNIVMARGGRILSHEGAYVNTNQKLRFICRRGHKWETRPSVVKCGHWCPVCMVKGRKKSDVSVLRNMATERGGLLLSPENMGFKVKHRWQCEKGHVWDALPWTVKRGSWCPKCARRGRPQGSRNKKSGRMEKARLIEAYLAKARQKNHSDSLQRKRLST